MNRYSKALKQLKSTNIDSKIKKLEETPTNNTKGVYSLNPSGYRLDKPEPPTQFYPKGDGTWPDGVPGEDNELVYTRPGGFWDGGKTWAEAGGTVSFTPSQTDIGDDGKNTDGLIGSDGTVKTFLPDGSRGFILGPLTDGFVLNHTYDAYTNIGYVQKDTRQFVILGRITGQWADDFSTDKDVTTWDGTINGFTAYNENFTLAMAQWMRTEILANRYYSNFPYFYSGGTPQAGIADCPTCPGGMYGGTLVGAGGDGSSLSGGGQSGSIGQGSGDDVTTGTEYTQGDPTHGDVEDAGLWGLIKDKLEDLADLLAGGLEDLGNALNDLFDDPLQGAQDLIDSLEDLLAGAGGSPGQPYTPPKEDPKNPWVPAPGKDVASGEGGSPGQPYVPPKEDPKNPWVPAPGKDVATHDKPFSHYPAAGGPDKWPGMPGSSLDILHPSKDPLLHIPITPYGIKASAGKPNLGNIATNYGDLRGWERDILQNGLNVRSGDSWQRELRRLQQMYPGFVPRVKKPSTTSNTRVAHYKPQGKLINESKGLRKVKSLINEITAAPVSAAPTNTQTTSQPTTQKTQSKQTANAVAKEYLEKNGPEKAQELLYKTYKVKDELAFGMSEKGEGGGVDKVPAKGADQFVDDYLKTFDDDTYTDPESIALLDRAIELNPENIDAYYYRAFANFDSENYIDALKDTERILEVDPNNKDVQLVRALIYQEKGDLELSLDELEKAIELNPDDAALQKLKTTIEGQLQQEIQKKDVPPDPNEEGGVVKRTKYYDDLYDKLTPGETVDQEQREQISSNLRQAIDLMTTTHYGRGRDGLYSKGAVDLLQEILPLDPNNPEILSNLGVAMFMDKSSSSKEALEHLEKARALDPSIKIDFGIDSWDRYDGEENQPYAGAKITRLAGLPYQYAREVIKNLPDQSKAIGGKYGTVGANYKSSSAAYRADAKSMDTKHLQWKLVDAARHIEDNKYWMSRGYTVGNTGAGGKSAYNISMNQLFGFMQAGMEGEYTGAVPPDVSKKLEDANKRFKETSNKWRRILGNWQDPAYDKAVAYLEKGGWKNDPDYRYTEDHKHIPGARNAALRLNAQVKRDVEEYQAYYDEYMSRGGEEPVEPIDLPKEGYFIDVAQKEIIEKAISEPAKLFKLDAKQTKAFDDARNTSGTNSLGYVSSLPITLAASILTGKPQRMYLTQASAIKISQDINANELANVLRIDNPVPVTARETIEPSKGKSDKVLTTLFGKQGGLYYNYDTETKQLYIESRKTLRTTSGGEEWKEDDLITGGRDEPNPFASAFIKNLLYTLPGKAGTGTKFTDIPVPTPEKIKNTAANIILKGLFEPFVKAENLVTNVKSAKGIGKKASVIWNTLTGKTKSSLNFNPDAPRSNSVAPGQTVEWDTEAKMTNDYDRAILGIRESLDESVLADMITTFATNLMDTSVNAMAANIVAIRSILTDIGVPASDIEKFGGAYGMTYSSTPVHYDDLPDDVKAVIDAATGKAPGLSKTDAAILAGTKKKKKKKNNKTVSVEVYKPVGKKLQESDLNFTKRQKRLIREVRNEYKVPELPKKYKMNFKGKFTPQNTPDKTASKESDGLAATANMRGQKWSQDDKYWAGYETTETMNVVYDKVGHGEQAWNRMIEGARQKNGWKNREIIEQLNIIAHEKASRKVNPDYQSPWVIQEASPEQKEREKNFDKVNKIKQIVGDTKRGDIQPEYPDKPAVELAPNGYHPNYGKKYKHDKLDPHSAEAMPDTGNPEIDANIRKATDHKKKARKLKNLLGKMRG